MVFSILGGLRGGADFLFLRRVMRRDAAHVVVSFRQRIGEVFENVVGKNVPVMTPAQRRFMLAMPVEAQRHMLLMARQMRRVTLVRFMRRAVMARVTGCMRRRFIMARPGMRLACDMVIAAMTALTRPMILMRGMGGGARRMR